MVEMLEEVIQIVKDRRLDYGSPVENFGRTAKLWSTILGKEVSSRDVVLCMIALKLTRCLGDTVLKDNSRDIAGYAACLSEIEEEVAARPPS